MWVNLTKARKPVHADKSVSKLCSHFLRHDKSVSHGDDAGLNEMRVGAGGGSCRPHVRHETELIHMIQKREQLATLSSFLLDDVPRAFRATQGHSVIEARPELMTWKKNTARGAPKLYHGTRFCNVNSILKHGLLPGKATNSGRSDIFFRAILTTSTKRRAEGDLRGAWMTSYGNTDYDNDDYVKMSLKGYHFDSEAAVVVDTQVAIMEGCEFFISESHAILCKPPVPKAVILKIRWATMKTVIWRSGEVTKAQEASTRVVLKENPRPPLNPVEAPSSSLSPRQPMNLVPKERDGSSAQDIAKQQLDSSSQAATLPIRNRSQRHGRRCTSRRMLRVVTTSTISSAPKR